MLAMAVLSSEEDEKKRAHAEIQVGDSNGYALAVNINRRHLRQALGI